MPKEPENLDVEGLLKGIYHFADAPEVSGNGDAPRVQLLASGVGFPWIQKAQQLLADDWGVAADLWSVTSWNELARDAVEAEKWSLNHPGEEAQVPYVTSKLEDARRSGRRGERLHARRTPADRALGARRLPRPRHRRLRLRRHPAGRPPLLPGRRRERRRRRPCGRSPSAARSSPRSSPRRSRSTASTTRPRSPTSSRRAATRDPRPGVRRCARGDRRGSCRWPSAWSASRGRGRRSRTSTRCSRASARSSSCSACDHRRHRPDPDRRGEADRADGSEAAGFPGGA